MNQRRGCIVALAIALLWPSVAGADNYVILFTARAANEENPEQQFVMEIEVVLDDILPADVTDVDVEVDNGLVSLSLNRGYEGDTEWDGEVEYADFASLKAGLDGTWTITIMDEAGVTSISTFTFDAATLDETDAYYQAPSVLKPLHEATDVALDTDFRWTDPTGDKTPNLVEVEVGSEVSPEGQEDSFPFDSLLVGDTSWVPPLTLLPGPSSFFVFYGDADPSRLGPLTVIDGSIIWAVPEEADDLTDPVPWPALTPVVLFGSFAEIQFDTERLMEDFEAYPLQEDPPLNLQQEEAFAGPFLITDDGNPVTGFAVAAVSGDLAERAGIETDGAPVGATFVNQVAFAGSAAGNTDGGGFLLIADIPALEANLAGPIADFFVNPTGIGRPFFDISIRAVVRETTGAEPTQVRFVLEDGNQNEAESDLMPLTTDFETFEVHSFDFFDRGQPTDFSQIVGIGIEFSAQPLATVSQLRFQIDDVEISAAPEPSSAALSLAALTALGLLAHARCRRRAGMS